MAISVGPGHDRAQRAMVPVRLECAENQVFCAPGRAPGGRRGRESLTAFVRLHCATLCNQGWQTATSLI
jgi:hypothetical protein